MIPSDLELDRVISIHLRSGHSFKGSICESNDDEVILFHPQEHAYHHALISDIIGWTDHRSLRIEPLFLDGNDFRERSQP